MRDQNSKFSHRKFVQTLKPNLLPQKSNCGDDSTRMVHSTWIGSRYGRCVVPFIDQRVRYIKKKKGEI